MNPAPQPPPRPPQSPVSRRTFLRGVGVTMALPWLESLPVWGAAPAAPAPRRFAALFMGCGINADHWWARGAGAEMELGRSLAPLAPQSQYPHLRTRRSSSRNRWRTRCRRPRCG